MPLTAATLPRYARLLMTTGLLSCFVLVLLAGLARQETARAILTAWLYWVGLATGSMLILLSPGIIRSNWVEAARPVLRPAAHALMVLAVPFVILVAVLAVTQPRGAEAGVPPYLPAARLYLNPYASPVRSSAILAVWSGLAIAVGRRERLGPVWAGIALGLYLLTAMVAAIDWAASLVLDWSVIGSGLLLVASQLTAAFAFVAVLHSGEPLSSDARTTAQQLLTAILAMATLIVLQHFARWTEALAGPAILFGTSGPSVIAIVAGTIMGVLAPALLLLNVIATGDPPRAGAAGLLVLVGLAIYWAWQAAPDTTITELVLFLFALVAIGSAWLGLAFGPLSRQRASQ